MKQRTMFPALIFFMIMLAHISFAQSFKYQNYADESRSINELKSKYGNLCKVIEIGKSAGSRIIYALEIGKGDSKVKPALLVIGGVEPDDLTGTVSAKYFAENILANSSADSVKALLDKYTLYVIPRLSPDPLESYFAKVKAVNAGNDMADDQDRDGKKDEDPFNDLNGDNFITMMRVAAADGDWIESTDDPMLMKKADTKKGEIGKFKLFTEGLDDDKDGLVNEDPVGGINVNKNTTHSYKPYTSDGGLHPFIATELRALGDFVFNNTNILAVFTFNYNNNLTDPWKIRSPQAQQPQQGAGGGSPMGGSGRGFGGGNIFLADSISYSVGVKELASLAKYKGDPLGNGSIPGWAFYDAGKLSFCAPAWTYPETRDTSRARQMNRTQAQPGMSAQGPGAPAQTTREQIAFRWIKKNAPQNYLEWKEFRHPDFPNNKVEIGGFVPFTMNNAPEDSLKSATANSYKLLYKLFKNLPDIQVDAPLVEPLGNGVTRVTLTINNKGKLPTHTNVGRRVKSLQSFLIRAKLSGGQKIVSGKNVTFVEEPIPGGGKINRTFLIVGKGKVDFNIGSPSAGYKNISAQL
jgi:hypothetical protein